MSAKTQITGYQNVRAAARDYLAYSSDLQGDRDVRDYRQLPLEVDPPRHQLYREAVQPLFMADRLAPKYETFRQEARELISTLGRTEPAELESELALPYVLKCLTHIFNRPQDYEEWYSWGPDVWTAASRAAGDAEDKLVRSGVTLQTYLDRVFDEAEEEQRDDVWGFVSRIEIDGKQITRKEAQGIANVLLAGGRDTVVKLCTGMVWHFIKHPEDRIFLTENPEARKAAIDELLRYLTPLPKMERIPAAIHDLPIEQHDPEKFVDLSFVSANFDRTVFSDPETIDIHRPKQPHLAFGFGRHSCMGMNITEHESRAFITELLENWPDWQFSEEPDIHWEQYPDFKYLSVFRSVKVISTR